VKDKVALKMLRWESEFVDFGPREYEIHQMDAIVTDRLTASPRIIDIFGFCAQSSFNEFADMDLGNFFREQQHETIKHTWTQSLNLAHEAALALADLHNPDGDDKSNYTTIAHRDLKPQNVIFVNGQLKLNDFNDAHLLQWNTTSNDRQCGFSYKAFPPKWAKGFKPREQSQYVFPLTEKIDIYALGGVLFMLLLEQKPYHGVPDKEVSDMIMLGHPPLPPEAFRSSNDPSIRLMLEVIDQCYAAEPVDRPTARWVADQIHRAQQLAQLVEATPN
jgi:serine/threonine protein kinase